MHVLLVEPEYYTQFPPLGLLKISAHHKRRGDTTELVRGCAPVKKKPKRVYVTSLFTWAWKPVWEAVRYYKGLFPSSEVWLGGLYASLLLEAEIRKYLHPLSKFDWSSETSPIAAFGGQKGVDQAYELLLQTLSDGGIKEAEARLGSWRQRRRR